MPLYEYYCEQCNHNFEQIRSFSEADETITCPNCFNNKVKRKLSRIATSKKNDISNGNTSGCSGCTSHNCANCN